MSKYELEIRRGSTKPSYFRSVGVSLWRGYDVISYKGEELTLVCAIQIDQLPNTPIYIISERPCDLDLMSRGLLVNQHRLRSISLGRNFTDWLAKRMAFKTARKIADFTGQQVLEEIAEHPVIVYNFENTKPEENP